MKDLNVSEINLGLPATNCQAEVRGLHMEVMNTGTRDVWLSTSPVSREFFHQLELEPSWIKLGASHGAMDAAGFRRSPGATEDGPLDRREFGGHAFFRVARPLQSGKSAGNGLPLKLTVDKHHTVGFQPGTTVRVLENGEGEFFVEAARGGASEHLPDLNLEEGMRVFELRLTSPWVVEIPAPATVYFFPTKDIFHGPLATPPSQAQTER